jgi:hypothetical protein
MDELESKVMTLEDSPQEIAEKHSNSIEDLASQYGWKSEGEKSAEEYVKVAMDKFPEQSKKIKQLFKAVEDLKAHMSKTETVAYERAKNELEQQRRQAIQQGDVDLVDRLEQAKAELAPIYQPETQQSEADVNYDPSIVAFESKYGDMLNDTSFEALQIQKWINAHGAVLGQKKLPVDKHMDLLEQHMKKQFPDYFEEESEPVSPVLSSRENVSSKVKKGKNPTYNDLSSIQKDVASRFQRQGIMTIEQYIADLVKNGDL